MRQEMEMQDKILIISSGDLDRFVTRNFLGRFSGREVGSLVAAEILGISISTLNRWIERGLVHPSNRSISNRVERKFNLDELLSIDIIEVKRQYRMLSKTM